MQKNPLYPIHPFFITAFLLTFSGAYGQIDFPGGDFDTLIKGIKQKLLTLPGKTKVYSGHGPVMATVIPGY